MTTLKENQIARSKEIDVESRQFGKDRAGKMNWCVFCIRDSNICPYTKQERDQHCFCAKAFNKMQKVK